ncbi:MAG: FkbM family methyltransferase [Candidatus Bathyarchaeia archaeon]|nr:FkbM family methyltransferase [Candidatus Bathyarchaeia archaeon]
MRIARYDGMNIIFPSKEDPFFDDVWLRNVYYPYTPNSEDVVFDIGAHMGFFTLKVARKVKWVIACEPDPQNFVFLMQNVKYNNLSNVKTFNYALGERNCDVFLERGYGGGRTKVTRSNTMVRTRMITLDTLVKQLGLHPDVIKIDVEGYELQILKGAKKVLACFKPKLIIAAYHYPGELKEIANYLSELGFKCFHYSVPLVLQKTNEAYVWADRGKAC